MKRPFPRSSQINVQDFVLSISSFITDFLIKYFNSFLFVVVAILNIYY